MVNFVIITKDKENKLLYRHIINCALMKWDFYYNYYEFENDNSFNKYIENRYKYNVYIIDSITDNTKIIIDKIRNQYNDLISFIIIIDRNRKINGNIIAENDFHTKILKIENLKQNLIKIIDNILDIFSQTKKNLTFKYEDNIIKLSYQDILYIEKESKSKNCIIVCKDRHYHINKTIIELESKLQDHFVKTHRSALANKEQIEKIDLINNKIIFKCGKECSLISRSQKKEIVKIFTENGIKITK